MITSDTYHVPKMDQDRLAGRGITVTVPGSKSITNRALLLAMLADGESRLSGLLFSDDSRHFIDCLEQLKFEVRISEADKTGTVKGLGGGLPCTGARLDVGSAGTAARFLSAVLGVSHGTFHMDSSEQMRRRPMEPLLSALREVGCGITFDGKEGYFPFTLHADGFQKDEVTIDIDKSSQFLSALLIAAPLAGKEVTIHTVGTHGMAYIRMTVQMMEQFGINVDCPDERTFVVRAGQKYRPLSYAVEPDVSAACYFYALAAILGIRVVVQGVHKDSLQGDVRFLEVLARMGCIVEETEDGIALTGPGAGKTCGKESAGCGLRGVTADLSSCSDQAITLAAIAPYASSPVTITGIGHIRHQESDRMKAIVENLSAMGIRCTQTEDSVTVYPGMPKAAVIHTYDDHRLAMGFTLTGLLADGIVIEDPGCCRKTFEDYYETLDAVLEDIMSEV